MTTLVTPLCINPNYKLKVPTTTTVTTTLSPILSPTTTTLSPILLPTTTTETPTTTTDIPTTTILLPTLPANVTDTINSGISLNTLQQHNSLTDCWVVFQSNVYDMTSWVPLHPGGEQIYVNLCGTNNFEAAFVNKHGSSKNSKFLQETTLIGPFSV
jgi:hypothetical protein